MADNAAVVSDSTTEKFKVASDEITYSGDVAKLQLFRLVGVTGAEGSKTAVEIAGTAGAPATGVITIQGVGSGTAVPVSLATVPSHAVTNAGTFAVQSTSAVASTATLTNVSGSATSVTLQASNSNRRRLVIYNHSESVLYVKYGSGASATSFTHILYSGGSLYEDIYTGIVTGIWDSAVGAARMTELTA